MKFHERDNPFVTIPGAYGTLNDYMRTNGLTYAEVGRATASCFCDMNAFVIIIYEGGAVRYGNKGNII